MPQGHRIQGPRRRGLPELLPGAAAARALARAGLIWCDPVEYRHASRAGAAAARMFGWQFARKRSALRWCHAARRRLTRLHCRLVRPDCSASSNLRWLWHAV
eukprot:scaffold23953_cov59-Phaeocystis_antarctica.AAC.5